MTISTILHALSVPGGPGFKPLCLLRAVGHGSVINWHTGAIFTHAKRIGNKLRRWHLLVLS